MSPQKQNHPLPMTAKVSELMSTKVVTLDVESATAYDVAREILNHDIGCVVVVKSGTKGGGGKKVVGIVTKGDILREAVMKRLDPQKISVESIMSRPVATVSMADTLAEASELMSSKSVSKLPVLGDDGELVGILSTTDIVRRSRPKKLAKDSI